MCVKCNFMSNVKEICQIIMTLEIWKILLLNYSITQQFLTFLQTFHNKCIKSLQKMKEETVAIRNQMLT